MLGVRSFQELAVYQLARDLRREVVRLTVAEPVCRDFKFVSQIRDAARGGPRNIAEGFSRFVPTEIARFLSYAKASIDETQSHLVDGYESGYFSKEDCDRLVVLTRRTCAGLSRLMRYLESDEAMRRYREIVQKRKARLAASSAKRKAARTLEP